MPALTPTEIETLRAAAIKAHDAAYCPYSRFPVGAAILGANGAVFSGCNVENASYGLTICAERNAVFAMVAQGRREILGIAVFTPTSTPTSPCGACRQVLNEFSPDAQVVSFCHGPDVLQCSVSDLLPKAFGPRNLE